MLGTAYFYILKEKDGAECCNQSIPVLILQGIC
jgi:hypothetical protein